MPPWAKTTNKNCVQLLRSDQINEMLPIAELES